jgi:DivIVA domain-containing protein
LSFEKEIILIGNSYYKLTKGAIYFIIKIEVMCMYHEKIALTMQNILEKEFKVDARGYRMQEVDQFLDIVIRDYNEYNNIIKELINKKKALDEEIDVLKQEIRDLKSTIDTLKSGEKEITNVDLLRRISQLEKIILGKEQ